MSHPNRLYNKLLLAAALVGIGATFLFQDFSFLSSLNISEEWLFIFRKTLRVVLNDLFMLLFIMAWFKDRKVTQLAIVIQLVDGLLLLPLYLYIKLSWEGTSEISAPLLSQFHRLIINPTLMILLIPAVYFQKIAVKK
ncbi:MAG: exosortase F system-associated protein [Bacteroidetes bacterium]|nr:exosortase F system-associated protein [Bacteroidota bacterium]